MDMCLEDRLSGRHVPNPNVALIAVRRRNAFTVSREAVVLKRNIAVGFERR